MKVWTPATGSSRWNGSLARVADDKIYAGAGLIGVEGDDGDDLIDARLVDAFSGQSPSGYDIEIDGGGGDDTIVSGSRPHACGWRYRIRHIRFVVDDRPAMAP